MIIMFFILLLISAPSGQDFSELFQEVEVGNIDNIRSQIPQLVAQHPDNHAIIFLAALVKERAEEAVIAYKSMIQNYPDSPYADDAVAKVGEYLYARGLYTQASRELGRLPREYPASEHVQRAIDLQINSLLAIGEGDSARYYVKRYGIIFPSLDFNYNFSSDSPLATRPLGDATVTPLSQGMHKVSPKAESLERSFSSSEKSPSLRQKSPKSSSAISAIQGNSFIPQPLFKPFVVQVGAFGARNNALRQAQSLGQSGFDAEVWPITVNGKNLYAVQVIRFGTRPEAEAMGRRLKKELNLTYLVVNRPER